MNKFFRKFCKQANLGLAGKGFSVIHAALWSLVEAIAWHWNLLCSYRIAFWFLLAASGKERSGLRFKPLANNEEPGLSSVPGLFGETQMWLCHECVPVAKALTAAPCWSLILKHLSCTRRAIPYLINSRCLFPIWSGSVGVGLSREGLLTRLKI